MVISEVHPAYCQLVGKHLDQLVGYIEAYRLKLGLSRNELAGRMGISKSSISKIMSGKQTAVTLEFIEKLSLLTGEDPGVLACLALGRETQISGDREAMLRRVAKLSGEYPVLWDWVLIGIKNLQKPARLTAAIELLKENGE